MHTIELSPVGDIIADAQIVRTSALGYLTYRVDLAPGYCLRSFFRMVEKYPLLAELSAFFGSYLEQYRACPDSGCDTAGFEQLEFTKRVEMIGYPGEPRLEIYHALKGISGAQSSDIKSSRLVGLLDLPLSLGKLKHVVFGDKMDAFDFDTVINLFEFIDGIAWELSFHGTPDACEIGR